MLMGRPEFWSGSCLTFRKLRTSESLQKRGQTQERACALNDVGVRVNGAKLVHATPPHYPAPPGPAQPHSARPGLAPLGPSFWLFWGGFSLTGKQY